MSDREPDRHRVVVPTSWDRRMSNCSLTLEILEYSRCTLTAADAHRHQAISAFATTHLTQ